MKNIEIKELSKLELASISGAGATNSLTASVANEGNIVYKADVSWDF